MPRHPSRSRSEQADGPAAVSTRVVNGDRVNVRLLEAVDAERATLLAVGTHGGGRLAGAAFGEATTMVLHESPASVLIARWPFEPERFPASLVAGIDGSPEARLALDVAAKLRERSGGRLAVLYAAREHDATAPLDGFDAPHELVVSAKRPVEALVDAAQTADLLVVGSRGLARSAGARQRERAGGPPAPSSVLVVRPSSPEAGDTDA